MKNQISYEEAKQNIGKKVSKTAFSRQRGQNINPKPFKSSFLVNTVKDVIEHPTLHIPAYTFEEDSSYVECRRCDVIEMVSLPTDSYKLDFAAFNDINREGMSLKVVPPDFSMQDFGERGAIETNNLGFLGN